MEAPRPGRHLAAGYVPQYPPAAFQGKILEEKKIYNTNQLMFPREREKGSDYVFILVIF